MSIRFLYKIHSGYDGFTPSQIPLRMDDNKCLTLGWTKYIDFVELGWECWIYFHGPHSFGNGIYVKGFVSEISRSDYSIKLRVREYSTDTSFTDDATSARIADVVSTRYRQVFLWPEDWNHAPECTIDNCKNHRCDDCDTWKRFPLINNTDLYQPERLIENIEYIPGYWIIPNRCYVYREGKVLKDSVYQVSNMFGNFKFGEIGYSYPLARGIYEALRNRELLNFDVIIPIPLSPDKVEAGEKHRTRHLASELHRLLNTPVKEFLSLTNPISKRAMLSDGYTQAQFERKYYRTLQADENILNFNSILIIDDVCTRGSTLSSAIRRIREINNEADIVVATSGQMIVKSAVNNEQGFLI